MKVGVVLVLLLAACSKPNPFAPLDDAGVDAGGEIDSSGGSGVIPAALTVGASAVANELFDEISYAADGSILGHAHSASQLVALGASTGCPDVFKHAYLMEPGDANPIRFRFSSAVIDERTVQIRFRTRDDNSHVGEWRGVEAEPDNDGGFTYTIDALRTDEPFLGETEGPMLLELFAKDDAGNDVDYATCWTHHPLAVPLFATEGAVPTHSLALSGNRLSSGGIHLMGSEMIESGTKGLSLLDFDLINPTDERVVAKIVVTRPSILVERDYERRNVETSVVRTQVLCRNDSTDTRCDFTHHPGGSLRIDGTAVTMDPNRFRVRVFEIERGNIGAEQPVTGDIATATFQVELPRGRFRVMTGIGAVTELRPVSPGDLDAGAISDLTLANTVITGRQIDGYRGCGAFQLINFENYCVEVHNFAHYRALTKVEIRPSAPVETRVEVSVAPGVSSHAVGPLTQARARSPFVFTTAATLPAPP